MSDINAYLPNYFSILNKETIPKYIQSKYIPVSYKSSDSTKELWKKHNIAIKKNKINDILPDQSLLDIKIDNLESMNSSCLVSDNLSCSLHYRSGLKRRNIPIEVVHPITLLARQLK